MLISIYQKNPIIPGGQTSNFTVDLSSLERLDKSACIFYNQFVSSNNNKQSSDTGINNVSPENIKQNKPDAQEKLERQSSRENVIDEFTKKKQTAT